MKQNILSLIVLITLLTGCAQVSKTGPYKGDNFLYNADRLVDTTYKVVNEFLKWEETHRATLDKEVIKSARVLAANMPTTYEIVFAFRRIYLLDPTKVNKDNFIKSLDELENAIKIVNKHYQQQLPVKK